MNRVVRVSLLIIIISVLFVGAGIAADKKVRPAAVDLHGSTYIGFINLDNDYMASVDTFGSTDAILPVYFSFGQVGQTLYGCMVIPTEDPDVPKGKPTNILLAQYGVIEGENDGGTISFQLSGDLEYDFKDLKGDILEGGKRIQLYTQLRFFGKVIIGDIYRRETGDVITGHYVGTSADNAPAAVANNAYLGVRINDDEMEFTAYFYDPAEPDEPYVFSSVADFNKKNDTFTFDGNAGKEEPDVNGKFKDGVLTLNYWFPTGEKGSAELLYFNHPGKKVKFKKVKPKALDAGKVTKVKIKHKNAFMGSLISVASAKKSVSPTALNQIKIIQYEYYEKYYEIWLDIQNGAKGTFNLFLTAPDEESLLSKKTFSVK